MPNGFVTFEGGEGAGKTTQIRLLAQALERLGYPVVTTREPGGSPLAERLRKFLLSPTRPSLDAADEAMIFAAARSDHLSKTVLPALASGKVVLCDRFADSTFAYQGQAVGEPLLDELYRESVGGNGPCLTIILDIDPQIGLARARNRRGTEQADRFEAEDFTFHRNLRERFLSLHVLNPDRYAVVGADRSPDEVHRDLLAIVRRKLEQGPRDNEGVAA